MKETRSDKNERTLEELSKQLEQTPGNVTLLKKRAALFYKTGNYGAAINDYQKVLVAEPQNKTVETHIEMIQTILRFANTDIYASPNTNFDPWLE